MFNSAGPPEEITIDDDESPVVVPQRQVVRAPFPRGGARGRARRGRPRLDPDTDLGEPTFQLE